MSQTLSKECKLFKKVSWIWSNQNGLTYICTLPDTCMTEETLCDLLCYKALFLLRTADTDKMIKISEKKEQIENRLTVASAHKFYMLS